MGGKQEIGSKNRIGATLTVNDVYSLGTMVDDLTCSKALASTKVKHGDAGAVPQCRIVELVLEDAKIHGSVILSIANSLCVMLVFAIPSFE